MKYTIIFLLIFTLFILQVSGSSDQVYFPDSDSFRPVYSKLMTQHIDPEHPVRIDLDVRDSKTGFARVYAWGENGTEWNLTGAEGYENYMVPDYFTEQQSGYPRIRTLRNQSNEYLVLDPGQYPVYFTANESEGDAEILVLYIYLDQVDMGVIENQTYSVFQTEVPEGLRRIIFITESREGTNLDLYIQKGTALPGSFDEYTYNATDPCSDCWSQGFENYIPELRVIENPEPGPYLMVTKAEGGDDFFYSYWAGIEDNQTKNG